MTFLFRRGKFPDRAQSTSKDLKHVAYFNHNIILLTEAEIGQDEQR